MIVKKSDLLLSVSGYPMSPSRYYLYDIRVTSVIEKCVIERYSRMYSYERLKYGYFCPRKYVDNIVTRMSKDS
jgi:hypothetical protein